MSTNEDGCHRSLTTFTKGLLIGGSILVGITATVFATLGITCGVSAQKCVFTTYDYNQEQHEREQQKFDNAIEFFRKPTNNYTTLDGVNMTNVARVEGLVDVQVLLDTIDQNGNNIVQTLGVRKAGTRVGVHMHKYGGFTTILKGTMTDYVQGFGAPRASFGPNMTYYMPANLPMSAANLGDEDVLLIDTFIIPPGENVIHVLEPDTDTYVPQE